MSEYPPESIDMIVESFDKSDNFVKGLNIISKYRTESFSIVVIEIAAIAVRGLKPMSQEDLTDLKALRWQAGNGSYNDNSYADYYELNYVDT